MYQGPLNGGGSNGGVSRSGLVLPFVSFSSFLGLSRFFRDFPDLPGDGPGIFPICPFPLSRPIHSTYEEQSGKRTQQNPDLSRKKWETPRFGNPPGLETRLVWKPPSVARQEYHPELEREVQGWRSCRQGCSTSPQCTFIQYPCKATACIWSRAASTMCVCVLCVFLVARHVRPRQGTEICTLGAPQIFFIIFSSEFLPFPQVFSAIL